MDKDNKMSPRLRAQVKGIVCSPQFAYIYYSIQFIGLQCAILVFPCHTQILKVFFILFL